MTFGEKLIAARMGYENGIPLEPSKELLSTIEQLNKKGEKYLCWYKTLNQRELVWLKTNGIKVKIEYDGNETIYQITWK